ncbi:hypothetical protein [Streptomyces sp. NPDC056337]|uniref:hypothetical protein n=1 Tax=Streptomyces sp. NPDC056337 TaxID=3345787 RepID=UPI0035D6E7E2
MTRRLRIVAASALLALAALVTPAAAATPDMSQPRDVGWGIYSASDGDQPDEETQPPTGDAAGDVGWG